MEWYLVKKPITRTNCYDQPMHKQRTFDGAWSAKCARRTRCWCIRSESLEDVNLFAIIWLVFCHYFGSFELWPKTSSGAPWINTRIAHWPISTRALVAIFHHSTSVQTIPNVDKHGTSKNAAWKCSRCVQFLFVTHFVSNFLSSDLSVYLYLFIFVHYQFIYLFSTSHSICLIFSLKLVFRLVGLIRSPSLSPLRVRMCEKSKDFLKLRKRRSRR